MSEGLKRSQPERWSRRRRREEATKHAIEAWLEVEGGFTRGDLRSEITLNSFYSNEEAYTMCPMAFACDRGRLDVCTYLYANGAAGDISRVNSEGNAPMHMACMFGRLPTAQWLSEVGAGHEASLTSSVFTSSTS